MLQLRWKKQLSIEHIIQIHCVLCYAAAEVEEIVEHRAYNTKQCVLCYAAAEVEETVEHRAYNTKQCVLCYAAAEDEETVEHRAYNTDSVFCVKLQLRRKKQLSIEHIIQSSTTA